MKLLTSTLGCIFVFAALFAGDFQRSSAQTRHSRAPLNAQQSKLDDKEIPKCNIDFNNETVLYASVPYLMHQQAFIPAITDVKHTHDMNYSTYSVPFKRFWELSGLQSLIPWAASSCCDGCNQKGCVPSLDFRKTVPGQTVTEFVWETCNGEAFPPQNFRNGDLEFDYKIPQKLSGQAVIGAGIVQFFFRNGTAPYLRMTDHNYGTTGGPAVTFDGYIRCMSTTANWFIIKQSKATGLPSIPDLPLFVEAK